MGCDPGSGGLAAERGIGIVKTLASVDDNSYGLVDRRQLLQSGQARHPGLAPYLELRALSRTAMPEVMSPRRLATTPDKLDWSGRLRFPVQARC